MRVRSIRAESGTARIPAEMVQLISDVGHFHLPHDLAVLFRRGVDVHDNQSVRMIAPVGTQRRYVCEFLRWGLASELRRGIKSGIRLQQHEIDLRSKGSVCCYATATAPRLDQFNSGHEEKGGQGGARSSLGHAARAHASQPNSGN